MRTNRGFVGTKFAAVIFGIFTVAEPSLDEIIERLRLCIVDARALQLHMLERILSMALLQAIDDRDRYGIESDQ